MAEEYVCGKCESVISKNATSVVLIYVMHSIIKDVHPILHRNLIKFVHNLRNQKKMTSTYCKNNKV